MKQAVLFDLDGVLIDSENLNQSIFEEFTTKNGLPIPKERFYSLIGAHKSQDPFSAVIAGLDTGYPDGDSFRVALMSYRNEVLKDYDFTKLPFKDAKSTLESLKSLGLKLACASSSAMEYVEHRLKSGGLWPYLDVVVTCDDFERPKPAPDVYRFCMDSFGLKPEDCLVVEDSPKGIAAGKAAEMVVIAKRDHHFGFDQSQADFFIDDLSEIIPLIRRWI